MRTYLELMSFYFLSFIVAELPTGYLADRLGYKTCMVMGAFFVSAANFFPIFHPNYWGFICQFVSVSFARSLISGSASAYLYEYLKQNDRSDEYMTIEGNARSYSMLVNMAVLVVAGIAMEYHPTLPYWFSMATGLVALFFALEMPNIRAVVADDQWDEKITMRGAFEVLFASTTLRWTMFQGLSVFVLTRIYIGSMNQPLMELRGFTAFDFGWILACCNGSTALGAKISKRFTDWLMGLPLFLSENSLGVLFFFTTLACASAPFMVLGGKVGVVVGLCLYGFAEGLYFPLQKLRVNTVIPDSRYRATLLSVESILGRGMSSGVTALIAITVAQLGIEQILSIAAASLLFIACIAYLRLRSLEAQR